MKNKILLNSFVNFSETVVNSILNLVFLPVFIESWGAESYGLFLLGMTFTAENFLGMFDFGVSKSLLIQVSKYHQSDKLNLEGVLRTSLIVFILIGVILCLLMMILSGKIVDFVFSLTGQEAENLQAIITIAGIGLLHQFPVKMIINYFLGGQDFIVVKLTQAVTAQTFYILSLFFLVKGKDLIYIYKTYQFVLFLNSLILLYLFYRKKGVGFLFNFSEGIQWELFRNTKYLFLTNLSNAFNQQVDRILVGSFLSPAAITHFEIITKIPKFIKVGLGHVNSAILPSVGKFSSKKYIERIKNFFLLAAEAGAFVMFPFLAILYYYAHEILLLWVGEELARDLFHYLRLFLLWVCFIHLAGLGWAILTGQGKQLSKMARIYWVWSIVKMTIILLFSEAYGFQAVLVASIVSASIFWILSFTTFKKEFKIELNWLFRSYFLYGVISFSTVILIGSGLDLLFINLGQGKFWFVFESMILATCVMIINYLALSSSTLKAELKKLRKKIMSKLSSKIIKS